MFFRSFELINFMKSLVLFGMALPRITDGMRHTSDFAAIEIEKFLNQGKGRLSDMNIRSLAPVASGRFL